jgi:hypothetical protein
MRVVILTFVMLAGLAGLTGVSGCSSTGNSAAAIQAMDNPPNSCGPGGSQDIEDCDTRR